MQGRPAGPAASGMLARGIALAVLGTLLCDVATTAATDTALTSGEREAIVALGPWPPAAERDRTNPASTGPAGPALGEALFHSARLSPSGLRCASCHEPWRHFSDGRSVARGVAPGSRNTPSLLDVGRHRHFGWEGARDQLWLQSLRPLQDAREMPATAAQVAALIRGDAALAARYRQVFGALPGADDAGVMHDVGLALAAYVGTLTTARAPFDDWRDQLAAASGPQEPPTSDVFPPAARRGMRLFVGRGGCVACHGGPTLTDDSMHASLNPSTMSTGTPRADLPLVPSTAFRTPGLRDVASTAPYLHDGSAARLCDAVQPHAAGKDGQPAAFTPAERDELVAFLQTLSPAGTGASPAPC